MPGTWFKRLFPRPATPPAATSGPPTRVVDIDLYYGLDDGADWTAEWGLLDEPMVEEITTNDLAALVEHVLADARDRWGQYPDVTVQWSLHDEAGEVTDVTGSEVDDIVLPVTLS